MVHSPGKHQLSFNIIIAILRGQWAGYFLSEYCLSVVFFHVIHIHVPNVFEQRDVS